MKVDLVVNGKRESVDADPAMPLLYALRDDLGLNNPKFGCGRAQCGACTVHVNGVPTRSCVTPLGSAAGKNVTTLSGLGNDGKPHPLQARSPDSSAAAARTWRSCARSSAHRR